MLHKKNVMFFIVTHIVMWLFDHYILTIDFVVSWATPVGNMEEDCYLKWMLMHRLDFIFNLKGFFFAKFMW
jgi:hypothetical protein